LPAAMIPAHLITISEFPLNASGKIDKRALPLPRRPTTEGSQDPATSPAEMTVADIYAGLLGIDQVGATDSFFDLGGNSLSAMRLVDMISRQAGVDIGVTEIFLHPTPRQLAATIDALRGSGQDRGSASRPSGPLVELSEKTGLPPLFLIHPVGGTVAAYLPLGQELADTFTVYGLESPGLVDAAAIACTLEDLVSDYTRRIREAQPDGPYQLAGWSMGGVIAFEVAQNLERAGQEVGLLVMLDPPFAIAADFVPDQAQLAARFVADVTHTMAVDIAAPDSATEPAGQLEWLASQLTTTDHRALAGQLRQRFDVFEAHSRMLAGYRPAAPKLQCPTLIVSASASPNASTQLHWPAVLAGPVTSLSIESDHYAFLRPPLVADVGASIRKLHTEPGQGPAR